MIVVDLAAHPDAFRAHSKPLVVSARFAMAPGTIETLEGTVRYSAGDAIVTGVAGENWPVPRARFLAGYDPLAPTAAGKDGRYARRPRAVLALRLAEACEVILPDGRGRLHGRAGDFLVQYAPGDWAIVAGGVFERTYER